MMKPKVQSIDGLLQLRYDLPHFLNTSAVYPLVAPNGSTIVVCGHNHGLLVVWRGGRPLKTPTKLVKEKQKVNGSNNDMMIIDIDDDAPDTTQQPLTEEAEYEDEEEELDLKSPYAPIVQHLDLPLGTAVLQIAFPRLPHSIHQPSSHLSPKMLQKKMVIALTCSDCTVRLIVLPLSPPSEESKAREELRKDISRAKLGLGSWGEQNIKLNNTGGHQTLPKGVSVTFAPRSVIDNVEGSDDEENSEDFSQDNLQEFRGDRPWDVLIASHSADLSGVLLIHKVQVSDDQLTFEPVTTDQDLLWRSQLLDSPAVSAQLQVGTNFEKQPYPRILVAESQGPVRIYECCTESAPDQGSWSLSLYPGLETSPSGILQHRRVLDAQWILNGKAIAVLTTDGEWGLWDLSPSKDMATDDSKLPQGINGGIPTKYNLGGWIGGSSINGNTLKSSSGKSEHRSLLAPMTPATRKAKQEALFTGSASQSKASDHGGIRVYATGQMFGEKEDDESVVFWHGDHTVFIASIQAHWSSKVKASGNMFGSGASGQPRMIAAVGLGYENRNAVSAFPTEDGSSQPRRTLKQPDFLITSERSLFILAAPLSEPKLPIKPHPRAPPVIEDQLLLARGELDINGMDRILAGMGDNERQTGKQLNGVEAKKKVGIASAR